MPLNPMHLSQRQLFFQHLAQTSPIPMGLEITKAQGIYLEGAGGEKYIDFISGIAVSNVGHCHPEVVKAIREQAQTYMHLMVYGEYIQSPQIKLAEAIVNIMPPEIDSVYFVNSGAEATEGAIKLAKRFTGRTEIISFRNAYHGSTHGALSVMGSEEFKNAYRPLLPDTRILDFNEEAGLRYITEKTAAVIVEPIQGEAGVVSGKIEFIKQLRKRCSETGTLLICDEIQSGFGRTGTLFAFEQYQVIPDIVLMAKGMGGGMPIGAFAAPREVMRAFTHNPALGHITTFGGHPVSCAASLACLQVIQKEELAAKAVWIEEIIRKRLQHSKIKVLRGRGAMLALEFEDADLNYKVISNCIQRGLISDWFLFCPTAMRIAPPLIISETELEAACAIILQSIELA